MEYVPIVVVNILVLIWVVWLFKQVLTKAPLVITAEQQDISGSWDANAGTSNFRMLIYHQANYFGLIMDGVDSWPVKFTYTAPIIRFETRFDGREYDFERSRCE